VITSGVAALASIINAICTALGLTTEAQFNAAVPQGLDPHYSGYLAGAGSGTTLGQACQKIFNWAGASGDVSQGTAGNMPLLLAHTSGSNYFWGSGVSGNYCSTPNAAANLSIIGDWEFIFYGCIDSLTGSSELSITSKYGLTNVGFQWYYTQSTGKFGFALNNNSYATSVTLASLGIAAKTDYYFKYTRNSTTGELKVYYSTDGISYTQIGATISGITGNITASTQPLNIGSFNATTSLFQGKIKRLTIATTIGGSPVVDFNPNTYNAATSQTSWVSATSETWTLNIGTAVTGYKAVIVDKTIVQYDGVDDRLSATGLSNRSVLTKYVCERYSKPASYMTSNASNSFLIYTNGGGIPRAAAATEVVFTGTTMFTKLDILTAVFGASGVTMVNNANQATGDLSGNSGTELYLGSGSTANYMNCLINTYIEVNSANDSTQRTAMWNVVKTMNNL